MNTALIVIDVQAYFMDGTPPELPSKIAEYIQQTNHTCVAFTIFQNQDGSNYERSLHWRSAQSKSDTELAPELKQFSSSDNTFVKHTYSAFKRRPFADFLKKHDIEKVEICGIDLEACVLATAYEAFDKGYEVKVLFDLSHSRARLDEAAKAIILRDLQSKNEPVTH